MDIKKIRVHRHLQEPGQLALYDDRELRLSYVLIDGERWYLNDDGERLVEVYTPHGSQLRRVRKEKQDALQQTVCGKDQAIRHER